MSQEQDVVASTNSFENDHELVLLEPTVEQFRTHVISGLSRTRKDLPSKYFYDQRGSQLFDEICELDEYYLTRAELELTEKYAAEMARLVGRGSMFVEFGSGSSRKTRLLLDQMARPFTYVPVDISMDHLEQTAAGLAMQYPDVVIAPLCADFTRSIPRPEFEHSTDRTVVYFPGSTIGNFERLQAREILENIVHICGARGGLIIGIDLQKDPEIIELAYNDSKGITAEFNKNLLARINRELGGDFDIESFEHRAEYNPDQNRIEAYLISRIEQTVTIGKHEFEFHKGESICTEYSHKYTVDGFARLAKQVGLALENVWTDERRYFADLYFVIESNR